MTTRRILQRRCGPGARQAARAWGRWMRCAWLGMIGLGVVGPLLASGEGRAQTFEHLGPPPFLIRDRMNLRPRELATGTRTERAGLQKLEGDSASYARVYVPPSCVGTRRCPLLFYSQPQTEDLIPMADKYGIITCPLPVYDLEATLTKLLRQFAIDPDKIAAEGFSAGSGVVLGTVTHNLHVFSRVALISYMDLELSILGPGNKATQFTVEEGVLEQDPSLRNAATLRRLGYPVRHVVRLGSHDYQPETFLLLGEWLTTSWAIPDPTARPAPRTVAEVLLTPQAVSQMATFWSRFMKLPDSIRHTARRAYLQEYAVPIGPNRQVTTQMVDIAAMAQKYYQVAEALQSAGLTAEQHQAYRVALVGARFIGDRSPWLWTPTLEPTSVLGQNLAFMAAHPCELRALAVTNMWETP